MKSLTKKKQDETKDPADKLRDISRTIRDYDYRMEYRDNKVERDIILTFIDEMNIEPNKKFLMYFKFYDNSPNNKLFVYLLYLIYFKKNKKNNLKDILNQIENITGGRDSIWTVAEQGDKIDADNLIKLVKEGLAGGLGVDDFLLYMGDMGFFWNVDVWTLGEDDDEY